MDTPETLIARLEEHALWHDKHGCAASASLLRDAARALSGATPSKKCIECGAAVTDGVYDLCRKCEEAFHAAEEAPVSPTAPEQETIDAETSKAIREYLWQSHGHHGPPLYGDDGEMQCNACRPTWDYRRMPLAEVIAAARQARWNTNIQKVREASVSTPSEGWQPPRYCTCAANGIELPEAHAKDCRRSAPPASAGAASAGAEEP
jgi:hypothetical protein